MCQYDEHRAVLMYVRCCGTSECSPPSLTRRETQEDTIEVRFTLAAAWYSISEH